MEEKTVQEINLYHLLRFYVKKWGWIFSLTILGVVAGFVYNNYIQTPLYKSDATLLVVTPNDGASAQNTTLINNYIELFKSRRVLEPVVNEQKANVSYDTLLGFVDAVNDKGTQVIKVSISTKDARVSQQLAEGAIGSFKQQVKKLYATDNVRVVDDANLPNAPYNVRKMMILALGAAAGLALSVIALFFVYDFNLNRNQGDDTFSTTNVKLKKRSGSRGLFARFKNKIKKIKRNYIKKSLSKRAARQEKTGKVMRSVFFYEVGKKNGQTTRSKKTKATTGAKAQVSPRKSTVKAATTKQPTSQIKKKVNRKPKS
ncbi:MAG TPA: Wzz/FepE/Etk N-terminal domain-containing protein [Candidatus Chromulinivoraceae bacterium]|nr:Wzz/FepE/Etk N-terminal domain-containing protein [Candidatus Chromulinivoraceae bacterium]